ncbi:troponin T, skeletal muscle-like [Helianthus annuus]|uniref:troponin T, skeletal muscle-like n=1 Tax=Helianthus annuus TaxID=4232 RepID=UPI000B8F5BEE|nr:troponin T, skeletal muscle-like [Helianthus annuus]
MENEFYNAFAGPMNITQSALLENEIGTSQKPPKLLDIDDYNGWSEHFGNWVEAYHLDAWEHTEKPYERLTKNGIKKDTDEMIEKLADALPHDIWGTYLMMLRNNRKEYKKLTSDKEFMEKEMLNAKAFIANASDVYCAEKYRKIREAEEEKWRRIEEEEEEEEEERRKAEAEKKKKKRAEVIQVRIVKEVPEFEIKADTEAVKVPEKCINYDSLIKQNNELLHNIKRLKESYDTLNREMNKYTESNSEQAVAMNTLKGAYMRQLDNVDYYTEKCAELELKIYPIVERLKTFDEEKTSEEKKSETKEDDKVEISGKSSEAEKGQVFRKQTNQEFLAKKQEEVKRSVAQKKIETRTWPSRESQPRLEDELVVNLAYIPQEGIDLTKVTFEQYTEATVAKDQSASIQAEGVKEKEPEGVVHNDSSDADDESTETELEIDMAKVGYGKVQLKKKPQKKRKGSNEEDSTYMPTAEEKKKL